MCPIYGAQSSFFAITELQTPRYKKGVTAIRSIVMNPFTTREIVDEVVDSFVDQGIVLWMSRKSEFLAIMRDLNK